MLVKSENHNNTFNLAFVLFFSGLGRSEATFKLDLNQVCLVFNNGHCECCSLVMCCTGLRQSVLTEVQLCP